MFKFSMAEEVWLRTYNSILNGTATGSEYFSEVNRRAAIDSANKAVEDFCERFGYEKELIEEKKQ